MQVSKEAKKRNKESILSPLRSDITISLNEVDAMLKDAKEAFPRSQALAWECV